MLEDYVYKIRRNAKAQFNDMLELACQSLAIKWDNHQNIIRITTVRKNILMDKMQIQRMTSYAPEIDIY